MNRCKWCNLKNPKYILYHDNEWCRLNFNEEYLIEMFILESFQAGLSWECVLNKREAFRLAFDNFDIDKISEYDECKIKELLENKDIIRNKIIYETNLTTNSLSDTLSKDLKKRGMKFVGSTIIYSFLQAIGIIYSHDEECFLYKNK